GFPHEPGDTPARNSGGTPAARPPPRSLRTQHRVSWGRSLAVQIVVVLAAVMPPHSPEMPSEASSAKISTQQGDKEQAAQYPSRSYDSVAFFRGDLGE